MADRVKRTSKQSGSQAGQPAADTGDARRDRWRKHRVQRRAAFVEAAMRALEEHGPELGMDHVAAEAGVTKPVLYRHFDDKADLLLALAQRGTELLFSRLIPALNNELAPLPRIRNTIGAFFSVIEEHPNLYLVLTQNAHLDHPLPADTIEQDKQAIASAVTALLGDYMRAFELDSGAAEPWAHGVVGLVMNTGEWWLKRKSMSKESVVEYTSQLIWSAIDGILKQHGAEIDPYQPLEENKLVQLAAQRSGRGDGKVTPLSAG